MNKLYITYYTNSLTCVVLCRLGYIASHSRFVEQELNNTSHSSFNVTPLLCFVLAPILKALEIILNFRKDNKQEVTSQ